MVPLASVAQGTKSMVHGGEDMADLHPKCGVTNADDHPCSKDPRKVPAKLRHVRRGSELHTP